MGEGLKRASRAARISRGESPTQCPSCDSKRIIFHAGFAWLMARGQKQIKWSCKKCKHEWEDLAP